MLLSAGKTPGLGIFPTLPPSVGILEHDGRVWCNQGVGSGGDKVFGECNILGLLLHAVLL